MGKYLKVLVVTFTLVLLVAAPAVVMAEGSYIGVAVGSGNIDVDDPVLNVDDSDTAFKIFGGHRFIGGFFVEVGYVDFGAPSEVILGNNVEIEITAFTAQGGYSFGAGPLDIFGKAGLAFWDGDLKVNGSPVPGGDDSDSDIIYGVGAALEFAGFGVRVEYELIDVEGTEDTSIYSLGATYSF